MLFVFSFTARSGSPISFKALDTSSSPGTVQSRSSLQPRIGVGQAVYAQCWGNRTREEWWGCGLCTVSGWRFKSCRRGDDGRLMGCLKGLVGVTLKLRTMLSCLGVQGLLVCGASPRPFCWKECACTPSISKATNVFLFGLNQDY